MPRGPRAGGSFPSNVDRRVRPFEGDTVVITQGYRFKTVAWSPTSTSTLFMLVSALTCLATMQRAYPLLISFGSHE